MLSFLLGLSSYSAWTPYADPLMVVIIAGFVARTPLLMLGRASREILMVAPNEEPPDEEPPDESPPGGSNSSISIASLLARK